MLGSSMGAPHLCTSGISLEAAKNWVKAVLQNFSGEPPKFETLGECVLGIIWEHWGRNSDGEGVFNLYQILIFQNLVLPVWNKAHCLFLNPCESRASCLWASDAVWTHRFLTCHKAFHIVGCFESAGTGSFGCRLSRSLPTGLHWNLELENVGWQELRCLGAAEQPRRLPKFRSPSSRLGGQRKLGSVSQLKTSEFGSWAPETFTPCSWTAAACSWSAERRTGLGKGTWWLCRWPQAAVCCSAPFWDDLSQDQSTEERLLVFGWAPFQHEGQCWRPGSETAPSAQQWKGRSWTFTWMPSRVSQSQSL